MVHAVYEISLKLGEEEGKLVKELARALLEASLIARSVLSKDNQSSRVTELLDSLDALGLGDLANQVILMENFVFRK